MKERLCSRCGGGGVLAPAPLAPGEWADGDTLVPMGPFHPAARPCPQCEGTGRLPPPPKK